MLFLNECVRRENRNIADIWDVARRDEERTQLQRSYWYKYRRVCAPLGHLPIRVPAAGRFILSIQSGTQLQHSDGSCFGHLVRAGDGNKS